jgi:hypothetical protein
VPVFHKVEDDGCDFKRHAMRDEDTLSRVDLLDGGYFRIGRSLQRDVKLTAKFFFIPVWMFC